MKDMGRAQRRADNDRIAANRRRLVAAKSQSEFYDDRSDNELAVRHPFDCGHKCYMCHGNKLLDSNARRAREQREAITLEDAAYDNRVRVRFQRHYI